MLDNLLFGIQTNGIMHAFADGMPPVLERFRMAKEAGVFDYVDKTPDPDQIADFEKALHANMLTPIMLMKHTLPHMIDRGWGRVVNIASAHGLTASPFKSAYVAAKHGIVGFTKVTALEMAGKGVTCNAVCPGYVLTPLVEAQIPDTMKEYGMDRETVIREVMLARQPSKEFATVEQLGGTVNFLCSDAAAQITGTTISVDGGWTAL